MAALGRGIPQKANLQAIGATPLRHSLVAGLFIPQFDNSESAVIMVADPEWEEFKKRLARFSTEQIGRAVSQVAYAKELAILELPNTANALVRAEGSDETVAQAFKRNLAWEQSSSRTVTGNVVSVERDYRWSEPVKLSEDLAVSGIRFTGTLPTADMERLRALGPPDQLGEEKRSQSLRHRWIVERAETSVTLQSPLGSTFSLTLLEE